jgi:CubicO group peptidase (beta-lactamase class C family)
MCGKGQRACLGEKVMPRIARYILPFAMMLVALCFSVNEPARAGTTPIPWVARDGMTSDAYQKNFDAFGKDGFRLVSVSGYVENGQVLYAALWRKLPAVAWAAKHGLSLADFKKAITDFRKDGMNLVYVDGYEVNNAPYFAGIWEKSSAAAPLIKIGRNDAQYQSDYTALVKKGYRLLHVSGYTKGSTAQYVSIWDKSPGPLMKARNGLSPTDFQTTFDDLKKQGYHLKEVSGYSPGGNDEYAAIWEKGGLGSPSVVHNGVPQSGYQTQVDIDRFQGYQPLYVQGFTSGSTARFNTIWVSPFSDKDFTAIKTSLEGAVKSTPVAGLSIAIAKNGKLLFAAGFGMADKENNVAMNVNHLLRIGSITKTTTSVAIFRLIQAGATFNGNHKLTLDSPVFGPDGVLSDIAIPPLMAPLKNAKVHHFLEHTSGIPDNAGDPIHCSSGNLDNRIAYQLAQIVAIPASSKDPVGPVPREPGTKFNYSNLNFNVLQAIIERVSGKAYQDFLLKEVFGPTNITAPRLFHIGSYDPSTGEAKHYTVTGDYAEYSSSNTCDNLPPGVGSGGWAMSAKDLLHYLSSVDGIAPGEILTATNRDAMLHRPIQDDPSDTALDSRYARGWITQSWGACNDGWNVIQGHDGGLSGAFSNMFFLQENGFSFVVIGNQDTGTGKCTPSTETGQPKPQAVACGGTNQPVCSDEPTARVIDLIRTVDWPNYDLF